MCGGGGGGGSNAESLALQRQSLALSREQFEESKLQWGKQMDWQKQKSDEQKELLKLDQVKAQLELLNMQRLL